MRELNSPMALRASLRKYASHLNREQRRSWMLARLNLTPRVDIGIGYVPPSIARQFVYLPVGGAR